VRTHVGIYSIDYYIPPLNTPPNTAKLDDATRAASDSLRRIPIRVVVRTNHGFLITNTVAAIANIDAIHLS
jgi:hypothetical protein